MAFQLPKVDHKAIFNQHRRERAMKRKTEGEPSVSDSVEGATETPPVQQDAVPPASEPVIDARETPDDPIAPPVADVPETPADPNLSPATDRYSQANQAIRAKNVEKSGSGKRTEKADSSKMTSSPDATSPSAKALSMVSLKIRMALPTEGQSALYDGLVAQVGSQQAIRLLLRRAFDDLRQTLQNEGKMPNAALYAPTKERFTTNKLISQGELDVARSGLDPVGIMNPMMFNRVLAERALALFLEKNRQADT